MISGYVTKLTQDHLWPEASQVKWFEMKIMLVFDEWYEKCSTVWMTSDDLKDVKISLLKAVQSSPLSLQNILAWQCPRSPSFPD